MRSRERLYIAGILLLALVLRLISLADHSVGYDEAFSVLFAQNNLGTMLSGTVGAVEHPLLYYLTLHGWMSLVGESVFAVRLWSLLASVATVGVMYLLGRDLFSQRAGLAAAFLTAWMPFHIQYAQETRMYSLLGLLLLSATWVYVRAAGFTKAASTDDDAPVQWRQWAFFGVLGGLAMHTQQLALFYLVALGLVPFLLREWRMLRGVLLGAVIAFLMYLPWGLLVLAQFAELNAAYWIDVPQWFAPLLSLRIFLAGGLEVGTTQSMLMFGGAVIIGIMLPVQIWMYLHRPRRKADSDKRGVLFALWAFVAPMLLLWLVSQIVPLYLERALFPSALMLYLLLGWFFTRSEIPRLIAMPLGAILALVMGLGLLAQYQLNSFPYSPVHNAMATIRDQTDALDDAAIVHLNKLTVLPAEFYAPELRQEFLADPQGAPQDTLAPQTQDVLGVQESQCMAAAVAGAERVWFLTLHIAEEQYIETELGIFEDAQAWLTEHYADSRTIEIGDMNLYHYTNPQDATTLTTECPS